MDQQESLDTRVKTHILLPMNTTSSTYLVFLTNEGAKQLVSIESILYSGNPIDAETGDDLELFSSELVDCDGDPI